MLGSAALRAKQREELARLVVEEGETIEAAAEAFHVCVGTARKWVARCRGRR